MADTPFIARRGLVSLGDITGSGHLQINTVDGLATATEALFLDSTDTVVSRSLGTAAFSATGDFDKYVQWHLAGDADSTDVTSEKWVKFVGGASITGAGTEASPYLMDITPSSASYATFAAAAGQAGNATSVTITTVNTNGNFDILYESTTANKLAKDTGGDFAYNPSTNTLTVGNVSSTQLTSSGLQVANINYPTSDGTNGQALVTNGSGQLSFTTLSTGTVDTSGTPVNNQVAVFTDADTIEGHLRFTYDSATEQATVSKLKAAISLSVGGLTPSATTGRIDAANDIVAYSTSDQRLKENVVPITDALAKLSKVKGVEFDWKELSKEEKKNVHGNTGHDIGVLAQEIEQILPEAVQTRENGYKAVRYEKIVPLLIQAINELQEKLDGLTK